MSVLFDRTGAPGAFLLECPNDDCPGIDVDGPVHPDEQPIVTRVLWDGEWKPATRFRAARYGRPDCPECGTPGQEH